MLKSIVRHSLFHYNQLFSGKAVVFSADTKIVLGELRLA